MKILRLAAVAVLTVVLCGSLAAQTKKKKILAIGAVKGFQHDSVSNGLATIYNLGHQSGLWDTYIKTDTQLITKKKLGGNAKNLDFFDGVFFYTTGELDLDDEQKAALMSFIKDDGKAFFGSHSAPDTLYKWPEYGEMLGGYFDGHPWNTFPAPLLVEDRTFPATAHFPPALTITDEIYQVRNYSRDKVRVLMRLDPAKIDLKRKGVNRTDNDFAVVWVKTYGKGRVVYNGLGHPEEVWDRPDFQKFWTEAIKWGLGMIPGDATPRPLPAQ